MIYGLSSPVETIQQTLEDDVSEGQFSRQLSQSDIEDQAIFQYQNQCYQRSTKGDIVVYDNGS